tara:strand:- start:3549 stop:3650 length:102 start_codon:yes stop_codon:yes gene_type:complete
MEGGKNPEVSQVFHEPMLAICLQLELERGFIGL